MLFRSALLVAGAGLAVAESLSNQCSSTLLSIAGSPDAACLDISLLAPLVLSDSSTTSIIPTVNGWLTGLCSQGPCSNATLQMVVTNVTTGCASDLASIGLATNDTSSLVNIVQKAYPTVRQVACLKDTSANSLCVTELLTDYQSASGTTLSLNNIVNLVAKVESGGNINIPQNLTCSNCTKAGYTIIGQNFPSLLSDEEAALQSECGASFTDEQMPPNIKETAGNSSTSGVAALSVSSLNVGAAMLVAVSSAFVVFA